MYLRRMLHVSVCAAITLGTALAADRTFIRGELKSSTTLVSNDLTVELYDSDQHMLVDRTTPTATGDFEFDSVPARSYEVRVVNRYGNVIRSEYINARDAGTFVSVQLPDERPKEKPVSGTVSVTTLQHKVPKKAEKEFEKAEKAFEAGDLAKSTEHLKKVIAIDPGYMQAHNNLGSRYFSGREYGKAVEEFQKAIALDPGSETVQSNLALALMMVGRYPEAEKAARRALEMGHSHKACLALGVSLKEQWRNLSEAVEHLNHAAPDFPKARLVVAQILASEGQPDRAAAEVKTYMAGGTVRNRAELEQWLEQLERK